MPCRVATNRLRYFKELRLQASENSLIAVIGGFLTNDTERSPWYSFESSTTDFTPTVYTLTKGLVVQPFQRQPYIPADR